MNTNILFNFFTKKTLFISVKILLTVIIFMAMVKVFNYFAQKITKKIENKVQDIEDKKRIQTLKMLTISTIDVILMSICIISIFNTLNINLAPLLATAGVLGLAIGFGAQKLIEDIISGIFILFEGQLRVGDVVNIQNTIGSVEKITLRLIVLRDITGAVHYFRNSSVSPISNYSKDYSYAVFDTAVAYKENISYVLDVIKNLGEEFRQKEDFKDVVTSPVEILGLDRFEDSSIVLKYRIRTVPSRQWTVERAFNLILKEKFDELNIEMPFPQRVITQSNI